jgi:hypothetical protein
MDVCTTFVCTSIGLYVLLLLVYLCVMFLVSSGSFDSKTILPPVFVSTCNKYMQDAIACHTRLQDLGFKQRQTINGDDFEDGGVIVPLKSSNFRSMCIYMLKKNIEYVIYFEEDAKFITYSSRDLRYHIMNSTIQWAVNNPGKWDIVYLGCAVVNPTIPVIMENGLILHRSMKGQLAGHSMMFNRHVAESY